MKTSSQKANLDRENVRLTKLPEKNLLKVQNLLSSNSQKSCRNKLNKIFFCFKVPSWQLKCNFENPAANLSPGVSKSLPQSRIENFRNFFQKVFSSELCSEHSDRNFDVPTEKKNLEKPIVVRADSGKSVKNFFFKRKPSFPGKVRLDIAKKRLTTLMKKIGGRSWNFWLNGGNDRQKVSFFNKKIFLNDVFLWAARMQQFWQTEEKL